MGSTRVVRSGVDTGWVGVGRCRAARPIPSKNAGAEDACQKMRLQPAQLFIFLLVALAVVLAGERLVTRLLLTADEPRVVTPRGELAAFERTAIDIFDNASASVVYIFTETTMPRLFGSERRTGTGSGFMWDHAGHLVTNYHVIEGAERIRVKLDSGRALPATLVGTAPDHDLAVVRIEPVAGLKPIPLGTSDDLKVGQAVYAIGNPFGLSRTLTSGLISALDRRLTTNTEREVMGVIQTDAAINPGNSGGPLLDSAGRLIGVNTAIISGTNSFSGIGFAVPVDIVNRIVPALIRDGKVPRPGIGITVLDEQQALRLGVDDGLIIDRVLPGSAAAQAGLSGLDRGRAALGDIIVAVNGEPVSTIAEFSRALGKVGIGKTARLTVRRNGQSREVNVRVMDIS